MSYDLKVLADHRDALLLAEAIGWLHDYRKCSDEHLMTQAGLPRSQAIPRSDLAKKYPTLTNVALQLLGNTRSVADLLDNNTWHQDTLGQYLSRCHNTAHFDKQEPVGGQQRYPGTQDSSPFGFEKGVPGAITGRLWSLPWPNLASYSSTQRVAVKIAVSTLFAQTVADTRRPINEVDLWNWALLVGSLYKAALASALLANTVPAADSLRWRLLSVRVAGSEYFLKSARLPDLLTRQQLLADGLNRVRELLEVTYPLGSEVYRDENGSIYVVPDLPDLLNTTDGNGASLRTLIIETFAHGTLRNATALQVNGEITPHIELEAKPWWGQDPNWTTSSIDEMPAISTLLLQDTVSSPLASAVERWWEDRDAVNTGDQTLTRTTRYRQLDICTVCGLRPQGPTPKAAQRRVCMTCEERRADRAQEWATSQPDKTIWTDEAATTDGILALVVGSFELIHWLDSSLLSSLTLIAANDPENVKGKPVSSKSSSFSRLRRIWETTRAFWQELQIDTLESLADDRRRLIFHLDTTPNLGAFHTYDLMLGMTALSVVWVPPENGHVGHLISADNLGYVARQLGAKAAVYEHPATAAIFVEERLHNQFVTDRQEPNLRNPESQPGRHSPNLLAGKRIVTIRYQENRYAPAIPILAEPRTFMALVPADEALAVVQAIQNKYATEMGKVRNRLPLTIGVVYAGRRTPLASVLDAGRRMLRRPASRTERAEVASVQAVAPLADGWPIAMQLQLRLGERQITVAIPTVMGDGATHDLWYPYWQVAGKPTDRTRWFAGPEGEHWVHVCDLRPGDRVCFTPSTFDFEYLDASARRFEVAYDDGGERRGDDKRQRPYLLEQITDLEAVWEQVSHLSTAQIKGLEALIEAKRREWHEPCGTLHVSAAFRQFVADTLCVAKIHSKELEEAAITGLLADALEIHLTIHKDKPQKEEQ